MYTTSSLFLHTLAQVGITHAFVNWGSDHPAMLEDLARQRVEHGDTVVEIITCPNEMAAMSAAQAFAQVTGRPAAVMVHVDVGTQVAVILVCFLRVLTSIDRLLLVPCTMRAEEKFLSWCLLVHRHLLSKEN